MNETKDGIIQKKVIVGFVIQNYRTLPNGIMFCESQDFIGDETTWEDEFGDEIYDVPVDAAIECPMLMVQPKPIPLNPVKDAYENGECPDCGEDIPDDVVNGQGCERCEHVFCLPRPCGYLDAEFEEWFKIDCRKDGLLRTFRGVLEKNPHYDLTYKQWCRKYYDNCVDI